MITQSKQLRVFSNATPTGKIHKMFHAIVVHCYIPALIAAVCALYVLWKAKGGTLLFRIKKTDEGSTAALKAIFGFGWAYGSIMVATIVGGISILMVRDRARCHLVPRLLSSHSIDTFEHPLPEI